MTDPILSNPILSATILSGTTSHNPGNHNPINPTNQWFDRPCTNCIKPKSQGGVGLSAEQANRCYRPGYYYCKPCSNKYQRDRYRRIQVTTKARPVDIVDIAASVTKLQATLKTQTNPLPPELLDLVDQIDSQLQQLLSALLKRREEGKQSPGRLRKNASSAIAEAENYIKTAKHWFKQPTTTDVTGCQNTIRHNLKVILRYEPNYSGPAIQDLKEYGIDLDE